MKIGFYKDKLRLNLTRDEFEKVDRLTRIIKNDADRSWLELDPGHADRLSPVRAQFRPMAEDGFMLDFSRQQGVVFTPTTNAVKQGHSLGPDLVSHFAHIHMTQYDVVQKNKNRLLSSTDVNVDWDGTTAMLAWPAQWHDNLFKPALAKAPTAKAPTTRVPAEQRAPGQPRDSSAVVDQLRVRLDQLNASAVDLRRHGYEVKFFIEGGRLRVKLFSRETVI